MSEIIQAIRGMRDTLPDKTALWQVLEQSIQFILHGYGYREIRLPLLEKTELFARSLGESTDIVAKEMYTFVDRNGESLTLRPEGTASTVRAGIEHGLLNQGPQRLWYIGPMFRYEKPQQGRLRQFHQIGAEAYGLEGPDIDAELIVMCARLWRHLGLADIRLELNTLGTAIVRQGYRRLLVEYFSDNLAQLDEDSRRRLDKNPLRILDSKNPDMQVLLAGAPALADHLDDESTAHFGGLQALLDSAGIAYTLNPRLVRGLDYYNKTVFEWITEDLGAQGAVCAGGRYDGLVEYFGGKPTPAIGLAMGLERLLALLAKSPLAGQDTKPHVYFIMAGDAVRAEALRLAEELRDQLPLLRLLMHCGAGSLKSQFRKADKSGADLALILGETEMANKTIGIKSLREDAGQEQVNWSGLADVLSGKIQF